MVLRKAFPQSSGFLDQTGVIAGLRPKKRGFQQAEVPHAGRTAVTLDLIGMNASASATVT
jgi:hypothetical protein